MFALTEMGAGFFFLKCFLKLKANFYNNSRPIDHNREWTSNANWSCFFWHRHYLYLQITNGLCSGFRSAGLDQEKHRRQ